MCVYQIKRYFIFIGIKYFTRSNTTKLSKCSQATRLTIIYNNTRMISYFIYDTTDLKV